MSYRVQDLKAVIKHAVYDERLPSYQSFYDGKWAERVGRSLHQTALDRPFFDLCISWKGISSTFHWPSLAVNSVEGFWDGVCRGQNETLPAMLAVCRQLITTAFGDSVAPEQSTRLNALLDHLSASAGPQIANIRPAFPRAELWKGWTASPEFQLALSATQRQCFAGLVFAYEAFLAQACQAKTGSGCKDVGKVLGSVFGAETLQRCWHDPEVEFARRVRNCLAHHNGRPSAEVRSTPHKIRIESDELQIMAPDVTRLYGVLRQRVEWFVYAMQRSYFPTAITADGS